MWTRRVETSSTNSTYRRLSKTVSAGKKSQAKIPSAGAARNCCQVRLARRGAGSIPHRLRSSHTVLGATFVQAGQVHRGCAGSPTSGSPLPSAGSGDAVLASSQGSGVLGWCRVRPSLSVSGEQGRWCRAGRLGAEVPTPGALSPLAETLDSRSQLERPAAQRRAHPTHCSSSSAGWSPGACRRSSPGRGSGRGQAAREGKGRLKWWNPIRWADSCMCGQVDSCPNT
jgi:hypothetical protein